jgi:hypothetical protein
MLVISLDVSGLIARLEAMTKKLEEFPKHMAQELTDWQTEDMSRRFPNTETPDENTVETDIWPTSRLVERDQKKIEKIIRARKKVGKPLVVRRGSQRPILRPELYEKLVKRMDELMMKELTWR